MASCLRAMNASNKRSRKAKHSGKENFDVATDRDDMDDFLLPKNKVWSAGLGLLEFLPSLVVLRTLLLLSILLSPLLVNMIISLAVNVTYANTQYGIFTACSANDIGVYTSCTIWYNLDTPPAVPLLL